MEDTEDSSGGVETSSKIPQDVTSAEGHTPGPFQVKVKPRLTATTTEWVGVFIILSLF